MVKIWRKEKYIRKEGFTEKGDEKHKYLKTKEETRRTLIEKSEQCNFCIILASSGKLVEEYMPIYSIKSTFSSLFLSSSKASSCCSFSSLTNFIDLGQGWTIQLTVLSGIGPQDLLVLTRIMAHSDRKYLKWMIWILDSSWSDLNKV